MTTPIAQNNGLFLEQVEIHWDRDNPLFQDSIAEIQAGLDRLAQEVDGLQQVTDRLVDDNKEVLEQMPYRVTSSIATIESSRAVITGLRGQLSLAMKNLTDARLSDLSFSHTPRASLPLARRLFQDTLVDVWDERIAQAGNPKGYVGLLSQYESWSSESLAALITAIDRSKYLSTAGCRAKGEDLRQEVPPAIAVALSQGRTGKVLRLEALPEKLSNGHAWAQAVKNISEIEIRQTKLNSSHFQWLTAFITREPPIQCLSIEECSWDQTFVPWLKELLEQCPKSFQLTVAGLNDEAIQGLAESLTNTVASHVSLAHGEITDRGAAMLVEALADRQCVLNLDLNQNTIGYEGYVHLFEAAQRNPLVTIQGYYQTM